ncbi:MAG: hypothetical protein ACRDJE_15795 [Dehalococcoidia bacterium]
MSADLQRMDVSASPELLRLAEEVQCSGHGRVLTRGDEPLVTVQPARQPRRRPRRTQPAEPDSLLKIIGIGESAEPIDIARHKREYLAEAAEYPWRMTDRD